MIHLALRTEYSFKKTFLHMRDIHKYVEDGCVGIADINSTFGHVPLQMEAEKHGFKPIFGVRLNVVDNPKQQVCHSQWVFIAKNDDGLKELYELTSKAWDQFYYIPRLHPEQAVGVSENIYPINPEILTGPGYNGKVIPLDNNSFGEYEDRAVYELFAGTRKHGKNYIHMFEEYTYPQHILSDKEWSCEYKVSESLKRVIKHMADMCNARIPRAEMVKWSGKDNIREWCYRNKNKIKNWTDEYEDRLQYELQLIEEKDYVDYFLITADMCRQAKRNMLVGPARGSSAGSLVCYLLSITEVDPIEHSLIFERFIDVNRFDLPDIDIDFPDTKRDSVIKYLKHRYGHDKVMCLANINRLKAKSAIGEFAKALGIPPYETDAVKGAIIERSSGDARSAMCITDTFEDTEPGKEFIDKYPEMALTAKIEDHASHAGKHAAGILVSTLPLCTYGSLDSRNEIIMMDKKNAEYLNLLKVDCLGLRNLSILEDVADQIKMDYKDYYKLPLDDPDTYQLFNDLRLNGIFQFEGQALQMIVKQMGVRNFNDIAAITALARPGALNSGGTARYIKYVNGEDNPVYHSDIHKSITEDTFGIVVYQEQMMEIARKCGGLSWADTSDLRRAASKSLGDEFFGKYREKFINGAIENNYTQDVAAQLWSDISSSGSWSFNKSHAVSYGLVSYWTAWAKANYPMEFAVASLNHASSVDNGIKLLRDFIRNEGFDYTPVDPDVSGLYWSYHGNTLIGGLTNIKGVGEAKAKKIIKCREGKAAFTPALFRMLQNPVTDYDILFPADLYWGHLYRDPKSYQLDGRPVKINTIDGPGEYVFIGCLVDRNLRDLNEQVFLEKRGGERIESHTHYLNFKLEDDDGLISCKIGRYNYESIGKRIAERGRIGKDWYLVRGKIRSSEWRIIDVREIVNLNEYYGVNVK